MPPRNRSAENPPGERRRQILDAALSIICQRGYYGFSIKEVALRCGLTVAGILHHFGSKVQLLVELLADQHERDAMAILAKLQVGATPLSMGLADVLHILREVVVRNSQQPDIVRLYSMLRAEALYPEHPAFDYFRDRERNAQDTVQGMIAGKIEDSHSISLHVVAVMSGLESLWLRDPAGFDLIGEWDKAAARIFS